MRSYITENSVKEATAQLEIQLNKVLEKRGRHSYASRHEALGIITEEFNELIDAVTSRSFSGLNEELLDIAVAALWTVACINQETLEW